MIKRYRLAKTPEGWPDSLPFRIEVAGHDSDYGIGDEFECELPETVEAANVASGLLELVQEEAVA